MPTPIWAVIPAWTARRRLAPVLDALAGQVARVVVVDNGSTDDTTSWLAVERSDVEVVTLPDNLGYAAAVNRGIERALAAGAGSVLLVNDDAVCAPGAVAALAAVLAADPAAGAASARMTYADRPDVLNGAGGAWDPGRAWAALRGEGEPDDGRYDDRPAVDYPSGAASLLRRAALEAVGTFDETYYLYYEDVDWGLRAGRAGWHTVYAPEARAAHIGSAGTAADPARRRYYNVRNRLRCAARYAPPRGRTIAWLETLALVAKQPARWPFARRRRDAEAVLWAVADHLRGRYGRSARFG